MYYVIKSTMGWYFTHADRVGQARSPQDALQFPSVFDALSAYREAYRKEPGNRNLPWAVEIVRVEETPGTRTLRLVSTRVIDAAKPVVIFDTDDDKYVKELPSDALEAAESLQDATVYPDLGEAITAIAVFQEQLVDQEDGTAAPFHIHQVEYVITEPTVTETVLQ